MRRCPAGAMGLIHTREDSPVETDGGGSFLGMQVNCYVEMTSRKSKDHLSPADCPVVWRE